MKVIPIILTVSIAALGGTLFLTNPTESDYAQYASQTLAKEVQTSLCAANNGIPPLSERIDQAVSSFCERTVGKLLSSDQVKAVLLENTERKNRIFFSTYRTTFPEQTYKTVGLFNRFYLYGAEDGISWNNSNGSDSGLEGSL